MIRASWGVAPTDFTMPVVAGAWLAYGASFPSLTNFLVTGRR